MGLHSSYGSDEPGSFLGRQMSEVFRGVLHAGQDSSDVRNRADSMTTSLYWKDVSPSDDDSLDDKMKYAVRSAYVLPYKFDFNHVGFFRGLHAAGIKDAKQIAELLEQGKEIELYEQ